MNPHNITSEIASSTYLTGSIILASFDFLSLADYAIKAIIGGAIWMGFKIGSEYFQSKFKSKNNSKDDQENE